jgi:hypothetical protein
MMWRRRNLRPSGRGGRQYEDKDRAKAAPLVACRPCAPLGVCVCIPRAELLDAPAPLDIQDDAPLYIPAPRTGN